MSSTIPIEDVARFPRPGWAIPGGLAFAPGDRLITYLHSPEGGLVRQLYAYDTESGKHFPLVSPPGGGASEENLSLDEKLRRERARQLELGVTAYAWSPKGSATNVARLLLPFPDGLYVQDVTPTGEVGELKQLVDSQAGPVLDPQFSPDGQWIAYVQADELWVVAADASAEAAGGEPKQLTHGARESGKVHGLAEYIAQEEMQREHGFWWSPDSRRLAFEEYDETHIPIYRIVHQGQAQTGEGAQEDHRYPFAGMPNARVRLGVVAVEGSPAKAGVSWMDLGPDEDIYLARVNWRPNGDLTAQIQNRAQTRVDLLCFDLASGKAQCILREENEVWVNLHNMFRPIGKGTYAGGFIWASERTGYRHLYLYDAMGELLRALTAGDWMVDDLSGVDEENGLVYFTATRETPLESHLYVVPLEQGSGTTGEPRRITQAPGMHQVTLDLSCKRFLDSFNSTDTPPQISLRALADGSLLAELYRNNDPRVAELGLTPPELVTLQSRDGETLYGAIYRPEGAGPFPTIVSVYGGPHAQMVINGWRMTSDLRAQYLRQQGFLVFSLDNRGSARRGLAFEGALKHHMGSIEVQDQVDGVRWLAAQGLANPARVGIYGWSYGGYMSAMSLTRAPETFKAAVAGAPVTAWDGYDTHYTEHFMGTPQSNPQGYADSAVMPYVAQMTGRLMLLHGLIDENVHFRHTARLVNALIAARKTYDLMLFPDERHSPRRLEDRVFMEEQIVAFFQKNL